MMNKFDSFKVYGKTRESDNNFKADTKALENTEIFVIVPEPSQDSLLKM